MRKTDGFDWRDVDELFEMVSRFLNPVLEKKENAGKWQHESANWVGNL